MTVYTIDELNAKSIFEVRTLAKEVGVSSPTKLNKPELVRLIHRISTGQMEPPVAPKRGRPRIADKLAAEEQKKLAAQNAQGEGAQIPSGEDGYTPYEPVRRLPQDEYQPRYRQVQQRPIMDGHRNSFIRTDNGRERRYYQPDDRQSRQFVEPKYEPKLADPSLETEQSREGFLEINPDGYGFLRVKNGEFNEMDAYVSSAKIKQYGLRRGDYVKSNCKVLQEGRPAAVVSVVSVNGMDAEKMGKRPNFDDLVPIYPDERIRLEVPGSPREYATRCIDLVSPIGKGQRAIIVSPPKAGKTTLLKMIAASISKNYPDIELKVLLIDERPEEVTDMQRSIKGEVVYSTFDELPEHHTKTAEMLLDRAKRMVEAGKDVVILLDSLTRLARAYNLTIPPTGRTLSGGIDPGALHSPKRFFGSARNIEKGGSLTIIATALIDTGSRMDDVIFEEFKGTGNMEIHLDRKLSEKRIFPAIDLAKSGTRKEELLLTPSELEGTWGIRKMHAKTDNAESMENIINMIVKTSSNKEFIEQIQLHFRALQKEGYTYRTTK